MVGKNFEFGVKLLQVDNLEIKSKNGSYNENMNGVFLK